MSASRKDSDGRGRGSGERVGWMFRGNWTGKQQKEGSCSPGEIARVEWRKNEREMRERREIGERQRKVAEEELFLLSVHRVLKAAFHPPSHQQTGFGNPSTNSAHRRTHSSRQNLILCQ